MDPITPTIPKIVYGTQNLNRIYHGNTRIWPIPPGYRVPANEAYVGTDDFAGNWIDHLRQYRSHPGGDILIPATVKTAAGTTETAKEGTVVLASVDPRTNMGAGVALTLWVAHNGNWWGMNVFGAAGGYLNLIGAPWGGSAPGNNVFRGFYRVGAYNGGKTEAQLLAEVPTNCIALMVNEANHTFHILAENSYIRDYMTGTGWPGDISYSLPPGMRDTDLIWPAAPGADPQW